MENIEKEMLYLALKAIVRLEENVHAKLKESEIFQETKNFIDKVWISLVQDGKLKTSSKNLYRKIDSIALDEQDAGNEEMMLNYYLYAIADMTKFFSEGDSTYLESPCDWALEVARFREMENILGEQGNAVILTEAQISAVENSECVILEKEAQALDHRKFCDIKNWNRENLDKIKAM